MENHETSAGRINYRPVFLYIAISREIYNARYRNEINPGIDLVATTRCKVKKARYEMSLWTMKEVFRMTCTTGL